MHRASRADASRAPSCLDEAAILSFIDGTLPGTARAHAVNCPGCTELVIWAAADIANGRHKLGREGHPFIGQVPPGSRLARYEVVRSLARGGMGEVYEGWDRVLGRRVALKVARVHGETSSAPQARLLREAQALARLSHPNVVVLHDVGHAGDRVFIAMQFLDGQTADDWLRTKRPWRQVLDVFLAAGRGLAAVHAANVVHRDFKPRNVMIGADGVVRLLDFGLASVAAGTVPATESRAAITEPAETCGTPAYMAPEQLRGESIGPRADQFAFCVALKQALSRDRDVPARLWPAIQRGLSAQPGHRFRSMEQLLAALSTCSTSRVAPRPTAATSHRSGGPYRVARKSA